MSLHIIVGSFGYESIYEDHKINSRPLKKIIYGNIFVGYPTGLIVLLKMMKDYVGWSSRGPGAFKLHVSYCILLFVKHCVHFLIAMSANLLLC